MHCTQLASASLWGCWHYHKKHSPDADTLRCCKYMFVHMRKQRDQQIKKKVVTQISVQKGDSSHRGTRTHSSKLFRPNCPSEPRPQENICPLSFRESVWDSPQDTATMICASRATTCSDGRQTEMFSGRVILPVSYIYIYLSIYILFIYTHTIS